MIKLKDLLLEGVSYPKFRDDMWDVFEYAVKHRSEKRGEAAFYGEVKNYLKKKKWFPEADNNQIELHAKMIFTKAFGLARKEYKMRMKSRSKNPLLDFYWNHKKWPHYTKEFIKDMSMYK